MAGNFPKARNEVSSYTLKMRKDHYLAQWLMTIPNNPNAKKNVVIIVDHMGLQWSGLLKNWSAKKDSSGMYFLEITFMDDLQFIMDFLLGPPNPALPIPIFQFPRVLPIIGPSRWAISMMILINLMRVQGSWWKLPDDPFDGFSWRQKFDQTLWQCHIKAPSLFDDSSLWTLLATRMDKIGTVISDALDDSECVLRFRRIMTIDGETPADHGLGYLSSVLNGALVLEVVDASGFYGQAGNVFGGALWSGFTRSLVNFATGFIDNYLTPLSDTQTVWPNAYYQANFYGQWPGFPWILLRDSRWSQMETADLNYAPATAVSAVVGGDNPYADQIAELLIQSVGNILGYFALAGFSSAGDIAATVIMPFLQGTILAWLEWKNYSRAQQLGWVHLWEIYQQGAEANAWSLAAFAALRTAMRATEAKSSHTFTLNGSGPIYPGLHFDIGDRMSSTVDELIPGVIFTDHVEQLNLGWDYSGGDARAHSYEVSVGKNEAGMSIAERQARLLSKGLDALQNIGVHAIS